MRGTVVTFTTDGADEVIDRLAKKYTGADSYPSKSATGEIRVTVKIHPDRISRQPLSDRSAEVRQAAHSGRARTPSAQWRTSVSLRDPPSTLHTETGARRRGSVVGAANGRDLVREVHRARPLRSASTTSACAALAPRCSTTTWRRATSVARASSRRAPASWRRVVTRTLEPDPERVGARPRSDAATMTVSASLQCKSVLGSSVSARRASIDARGARRAEQLHA